MRFIFLIFRALKYGLFFDAFSLNFAVFLEDAYLSSMERMEELYEELLKESK